MNLELHSLKESLSTLTKEVQELRALVKTSAYAQYFVIQYDLEYLEPIQIETLLKEMQIFCPVKRVYTILSQVSDKTYENPLLNIFRYNIHLTMFLQCKKKMYIHQWDAFFEPKLGTAYVDHYISFSEFQTVVESSRTKINGYYVIQDGNIISEPIPVFNKTMQNSEGPRSGKWLL